MKSCYRNPQKVIVALSLFRMSAIHQVSLVSC